MFNSYLVKGQTGGTIDTDYNGKFYSFPVTPMHGMEAMGVIFTEADKPEQDEAVRNCKAYVVTRVVRDHKMGFDNKNEALIPDDVDSLIKMFGKSVGLSLEQLSGIIQKFKPEDYENVRQNVLDILKSRGGENVVKESDDTTGLLANADGGEGLPNEDDEFDVVDTPILPNVDGGNPPNVIPGLTREYVESIKTHKEADEILEKLGIAPAPDAKVKEKLDVIINSQKL